MTKRPLAAERLRELLDYDPETGVFQRKVSTRNGKSTLSVVGYRSAGGYLMVGIDGGRYYLHRLAFYWMEGRWPPEAVDHVNGALADNRWANLRKASTSQNASNSSRKIGGLKGVFFHRNAYRAQVCHNKKIKHIGSFKTELSAHLAYCKVAKELHGEFFNNGVHGNEIFDAI